MLYSIPHHVLQSVTVGNLTIFLPLAIVVGLFGLYLMRLGNKMNEEGVEWSDILGTGDERE